MVNFMTFVLSYLLFLFAHIARDDAHIVAIVVHLQYAQAQNGFDSALGLACYGDRGRDL